MKCFVEYEYSIIKKKAVNWTIYEYAPRLFLIGGMPRAGFRLLKRLLIFFRQSHH